MNDEAIKINEPSNRKELEKQGYLFDKWGQGFMKRNIKAEHMTNAQIAQNALYTLGWRWIARDDNGMWYAYTEKPRKLKDVYIQGGHWAAITGVMQFYLHDLKALMKQGEPLELWHEETE